MAGVMKLFESLDDDLPNVFPERPTRLAIGVFDGLHLGHRALIGEAVAAARAHGDLAGALTFRRHPLALLAPPYEPPRLATRALRRKLLAETGLDFLVEVEFTREFAAIEPEAFVRDILAGKLRAAQVTCGDNHRFGNRGR